MGALVALPPTYDLASLETEPAKIVATTLQRYGAYIVDGTGWSTAAFAVEWSPAGRVRDEFQEMWGFPMVGDIQSSSGEQKDFLEDMIQIYRGLHVVDDNAPDSVGGGGPRMATWAPPLADRSDG
jgi:hypothetical protein